MNFYLVFGIAWKINHKDKLHKWGVTNELICPLCNEEEECIEHMFFEYKYSIQKWGKMLKW